MIKKYISLFLGIVLLCFTITGCSNGKLNEIANENASDLESTYHDSENKKNINQENINQKNINQENVNHENVNLESENHTEINKEDTKQNTNTYEKLEGYIEEEIAIDAKIKENTEQYIGMVKNTENKLELYTIDKEASSDSPFIWKYTLNGEIWEKDKITWLDSLRNEIDQWRITILLGEDGEYYAHYVAGNELSHMVRKNGDGIVEIPIPDWDKSPERDYYMIPDNVAVLKNGNIVMASRTKKCFIYDKEDGSIIDIIERVMFSSLMTKENTIIMLNDELNAFIIYDAVQQKIIHSINGNFEGRTLIDYTKNEIYACFKKGIYKANQNDDEWVKILDGGTYKFANKSETLLKFFVIGDSFYVLYGENGVRLMKYSKGDESIEKEKLTIYSLEKNEAIKSIISEFQLKYPNIDIVYEIGMIEGGAATTADSIRALNTRILAGEGPDIFILDGLPASSYIDKGILKDINEDIKGIKDELHQGIVSAYTDERGIYMLPVRFSVPVIISTSQNTAKAASLESLVEYSKSQGGHIFSSMTYEEALKLLYNYYSPDIIFEKEKVEQAKLEEFLMLVKGFCESEDVYELNDENEPYNGMRVIMDISLKNTEIAFVNINGMGGLYDLPNMIETVGGKMISIDSSFMPIGLLGISSLSKNQALASLFLNEALSYELQKMKYMELIGFPINNQALSLLSDLDFSHVLTSYASKGDRNIYTSRLFNQDEAADMIEIAKGLDNPWESDETIWQIIKEEAVSYLKGMKELSSTTGVIMNRIQLYLYE